MSLNLPVFPALSSRIPRPSTAMSDRPHRPGTGGRRQPGTARFFLKEAVQAARRLSYRAVLYRIDGIAIGSDGALDGSWESAWKYHFMDPKRPGWGAVVCVSRGDVAFVRGEACDLDPVPVGYWQIDSPRALRQAYDAGRVVHIPATMRLEASSGSPRWWIGHPLGDRSIAIDASSGERVA